MNGVVYLNHATTSWPKRQEVVEAISRAVREVPSYTNRSTVLNEDPANRLRETVSRIFHFDYLDRVIICPSATYGLNQAILGLALQPGDHIVTTAAEHNAVLRPIALLRKRGVMVDYLPCDSSGAVDLASIKSVMRENTRLVAVTHASNVTGAVNDIASIAEIVHRHKAILLVDACQTAGIMKVSMHQIGADLLVFSGHKWLGGPPGIGLLLIGKNVELNPLILGGTGNHSHLETMPDMLPLGLEAGTPNELAIVALNKSLETMSFDFESAYILTDKLRSAVTNISGFNFYLPDPFVPIISFTSSRFPATVLGEVLHDTGIICRAGLHCAPKIHHYLGTWPLGTCRISIGMTNTEAEIDYLISVLKRLSISEVTISSKWQRFNLGGIIREALHCIDKSIWDAEFDIPLTENTVKHLSHFGRLQVYHMPSSSLFSLEVPGEYVFKGVINSNKGQFFLTPGGDWEETIGMIQRTYDLRIQPR